MRADATVRRFSWKAKAVLGFLLAGTLATLLLLGTELGLRLAGVGHAPGFWRIEPDAEGTRWVRDNPWVTIPYFAPDLARRPQAFRLALEKPPGTYRIFVLGSSAAMGDPEASFSIARTLDVLLRAAYPKIRFEVVNAGVTAVNSHVVRGIAQDCAELKPDLFFVYEGNNEVIGPFGPGTVFTAALQSTAAIRASTFLRGLRIGQLLGHAARRGAEGPPEDWGGMAMFLEQRVRADDPRLEITRTLFEANLRAICETGRAAGARVVLGTVLANLRDFSPFQSLHRPGFTPAQEANYAAHLAAAAEAAGRRDFATAETRLRAALALDPEYAEGHYQWGRLLLASGRAGEARGPLQRALDLDVLRFRTDSRLNETIRSVATSLGDQGTRMLDLARLAEEQSPGGCIGDEFLYEHVHLSFRGTYLVARALFGAVSEDLSARGRIPSAPEPLGMDEVRERLAFTTYEQGMVVQEMLARLQRPPFTQQTSNPDRVAAYRQRSARVSQLLSTPGAVDAFAAIYEAALASRAPEADWVLHRNYGMAMLALGRVEAGRGQLERARALIPDDPDTLASLALAYRALGDEAAADRLITALRAIAPSHPAVR